HKLPAVQWPVIEAAIAAQLDSIRDAANKGLSKHAEAFAAQPGQMRLVSPLADGADIMAAEAALQLGYRIDACLPFLRAEYAKDFTDESSRAAFDTLLARCDSVFELDGDRNEAEAAYETAGKVLLDQADILIAVWDGNLGRGRGGTSRVVADAVSRHIPVIHIDTTGPREPMLLWSGLLEFEIDQPGVEAVPRTAATRAIPFVVSTLLVPPDNPVDQRMLARFHRERLRRFTPALPYPLLLAMTGARALRRADLKAPSPASCAAALGPWAEQAEPGSRYRQALLAGLFPRYGTADAASTYFAQVFRSGFVANFGLAAFAVLLALTGLLVPAYKMTLILAELVVIAIIFANTRAGTKAGWHETWMDDRHLAEQLRALAMTSQLGNLNLRASASGETGALPGWVNWLARATARELGLPNAVADRRYLDRVQVAALNLVREQIAYHHGNAHRMHKLEHRLHKIGSMLFGGTAAACVLWVAAKLTGAPMQLGAGIGITELVTWITAAMPALGAAIYGIRMQGDFVGIAFRSEVTVARLERVQRSLDDENLDYAKLMARLKRLSDIMLSDVEHWRTTYQARPLALPG
ncbi:MAG: hypothetical protein JNK75_15300, partial [Betaproteobacteria bacterium]|nr:hypothetical protein [Betaproteobacteria bacterium]